MKQELTYTCHGHFHDCLQAKRETNDDRQREFEQRLQQHQAQMDHARAALAAAEAKVTECHQQKDGMRATIQAKEEEVRQLQMR